MWTPSPNSFNTLNSTCPYLYYRVYDRCTNFCMWTGQGVAQVQGCTSSSASSYHHRRPEVPLQHPHTFNEGKARYSCRTRCKSHSDFNSESHLFIHNSLQPVPPLVIITGLLANGATIAAGSNTPVVLGVPRSKQASYLALYAKGKFACQNGPKTVIGFDRVRHTCFYQMRRQ